MNPLTETILFYICASIVLLMPFYFFLLYKIIIKEYKNEIKKAKENQKKINK